MGNNAIEETVPGTVSFEENTPAIQQYLLRGISQQINSLQYPKLEILQQMYKDAGLVLKTRTEHIMDLAEAQNLSQRVKDALASSNDDSLKVKAIRKTILS